MAAVAGGGAASSLLSAPSPRGLPFAPNRKHLAAAKTLTLSSQKAPRRTPCPLASSAPGPPPPPEEAEKADPIKLAFARAAAYKKERDSPAPAPAPPPPPLPQASSEGSAGKEAFARALEYRNGNGNGPGPGAGGGGSALLGESRGFGQETLLSREGTLGKVLNKKEEYEYDETDFLGLDFFEKKRYKGPPPGLAPSVDPFPDEDFPEVEIIIGDPRKFEKSRRSTEVQLVDDKESEETSRSTTSEPNEDEKVEIAPPSNVAEPEDENGEFYKPTVRSWGMFPRPQNISKAYGGGRNIRLGGETQTAEEKAAKDKRTRELIAAYRNRQNMVIDAKTKAECKEALREGDELMNTGRLKQALPYYEKVMKAVDFKTELHGMAALQWSICLDSLCRSKEAMSMYSKLKNHPNSEISKKANMFMFSFQAMDFMKVSSMPMPKNTGYEMYFNKFGGQKNYYANLDEPKVGIDQIIPYMIFLVSPIFLVAIVALRKSFQL